MNKELQFKNGFVENCVIDEVNTCQLVQDYNAALMF